MEKEIDRLIDEKIKQGYSDQRIIDEIFTGGSKASTRSEVEKLEEEKEQELLQYFKKTGTKPFNFDDVQMEDGGGFEQF